jgi:hypothetical protein
MQGIVYFRNLALCLILLLGNAAMGDAAATLQLVSAGNGVYYLQGAGFNGVAGTDVVIQYDRTQLANPKVTWGNLASGSQVANTNTAGQLHIAAVDLHANASAPATGTFATITFDRVGQSSGKITAQADLIDINGARLSPVQVSAVSIADTSGSSQTAQDPSSDAVTTSGTTSTTSSASNLGASSGGNIATAWLGGVTLPIDGTVTTEKKKEDPPPPMPELVQEKEKPVAMAYVDEPQPVNKTSPAETVLVKKAAPVKSVLEQFQLYRGEESPKALMALFKSVVGIAQEPPVALSDGKAKVKAFIDHHAAGKQALNFALKGAKLASFKLAGDSTWVIELIPEKGAYKASVTILQDGGMEEIPLTVAPAIPAESKIGNKGKLTEADFILFLKERGTEKASRFDLNGDGKRDYLDDYIFTANFIALNGPVMKDKANVKK